MHVAHMAADDEHEMWTDGHTVATEGRLESVLVISSRAELRSARCSEDVCTCRWHAEILRKATKVY